MKYISILAIATTLFAVGTDAFPRFEYKGTVVSNSTESNSLIFKDCTFNYWSRHQPTHVKIYAADGEKPKKIENIGEPALTHIPLTEQKKYWSWFRTCREYNAASDALLGGNYRAVALGKNGTETSASSPFVYEKAADNKTMILQAISKNAKTAESDNEVEPGASPLAEEFDEEPEEEISSEEEVDETDEVAGNKENHAPIAQHTAKSTNAKEEQAPAKVMPKARM